MKAPAFADNQVPVPAGNAYSANAAKPGSEAEAGLSETTPSLWFSRFINALATNEGTAEPRVVRSLGDVIRTAPNGLFPQGSTRASGTPFLRGLGGSSATPYVTTYHDGVPHLSGRAANLELLDVEPVAVLPGPQGGRFGKNSVGGIIDIISRRPSLKGFGGEFETTFGNYNLYDFRGRITAPLLQDQLGFSFAGGYQERDGYSENPASGNDLDSRSAWFGKAQFLWVPDKDLEVRLILAGESARDGGYALNDIRELHKKPRQSAPMDLEGYTERDFIQPTLRVTWHGDQVEVTSITGYSWWRTEELVDLDQAAEFPLHPGLIPPFNYSLSEAVFRTARSFLSRYSREEQSAFTQEFRFGNPAGRPISLREGVDLSWQAGVFLFHQTLDREQEVIRAPLDFVSPLFPSIAGQKAQALSEMESYGGSFYAEGKLTFWDRVDVSAGLRWEYEKLSGSGSYLTPPGFIVVGGAPVADFWVHGYDIFTSSSFWSPNSVISWHLTPNLTTHLAVSMGSQVDVSGHDNDSWFSLVGRSSKLEQWRTQNLTYEWGLNGRAFRDKMFYGLRLFYSDLKSVGPNVHGKPLSAVYPASDLSGSGSADAYVKGLELNLRYQPLRCWEIYGQAAWNQSSYRGTDNASGSGAMPGIAGNSLPYTPDYTAAVGTMFQWHVWRGLSAYAGADVQFVGPYNYDSLDQAGQDAYSLASFRLGVRHRNWFAEAFVHNAFGTEYVPVAFLQDSPYILGSGNFDSRYAGESGAPTTFGMRVGVRF